MKTALLQKLRHSAGFTMIELLIVIAILGILAVAVLAAINPVEQINRGRDTGTRSDAEQLIGAMDRWNAFKGFAVFQGRAADADAVAWTQVDDTWAVNKDDSNVTCNVLTRLGTETSAAADCENTDELKDSFITKISDPTYVSPLFVYNRGTQTGDSTYVCFEAQSKAFRSEALTRCGTAGAGLPTDLQPMKDTICANAAPYICLP